MNASEWIISQQGFDPADITASENRFLAANGYLGIRGSLDEYRKEHLPAINLAGVYDQVGNAWREPVNAPNALYLAVRVGGEYLTLPGKAPESHVQELNYRCGLQRRVTVWRLPMGCVELTTERFASIARPHLICQRASVRADFHADLELLTGIDADVWDINGPHFDEVSFDCSCAAQGRDVMNRSETFLSGEECRICCSAVTHEKKTQVVAAEAVSADHRHEQRIRRSDVPAGNAAAAEGNGIYHRIFRITESGETFAVLKRVAVYTSEDQDTDGSVSPAARAEALLDETAGMTFDDLLAEQAAAWENIWAAAAVEIEGDDAAQTALNYSIYHLMSIAPRACTSRSIPARGLSGQTYKGAVFWDTEMFMMDLFLNTFPEEAKRLIRYRIDTLPGALEKAAQYGYDGAFYAWESQEGGYDGCSDYNVTDVFTGRPMRTYFRDRQYHISAAVVYALCRYLEMTGDQTILAEGGTRMIFECARFYDSLLMRRAHEDVYQILGAIGPDEYHEHVNNNGYTNRMAKLVFETAANVLQNADDYTLGQLSVAGTAAGAGQNTSPEALRSDWIGRFTEDAKKIKLQLPGADGIVEQFDGYFGLENCSLDDVRGRILNPKEYWGGAYGVAAQTQILKQADVVAQIALFPEEYTEQQRKDNWAFYEPRTEHGSSLSATMYGLLACMNGQPDEAYRFFMKSAQADIVGGGKEWAGEIYIGGTHPAAEGGSYMIATRGFAGLSVHEGKLCADGHLPTGWKSLAFQVRFHGTLYRVRVDADGSQVQEMP